MSFISRKKKFLDAKGCETQPSASAWVQTKTQFFAKIRLNYLAFSFSYIFFCIKNVEKAYFGQHKECPAPKPWSKFTTLMLLQKIPEL